VEEILLVNERRKVMHRAVRGPDFRLTEERCNLDQLSDCQVYTMDYLGQLLESGYRWCKRCSPQVNQDE